MLRLLELVFNCFYLEEVIEGEEEEEEEETFITDLYLLVYPFIISTIFVLYTLSFLQSFLDIILITPSEFLSIIFLSL